MKLIPKILTVILLVLISQNLIAQEISTDRPDRTESTETVGKNKFQIETGIEYGSIKNKNSELLLENGNTVTGDVKLGTLTVPTTLLRYGLTDKVELRLGIDFDAQYFRIGDIDSLSNNSKLSLNAPQLGAKFSLYNGEGWKPDFAIIAGVKIPNVGDELKQVKHFVPEFTLAFNNDITSKISVGYNLGVEWNDEMTDRDLFSSISFAFELTPQLGSFLEYYGNFPKTGNDYDNNIDAGFTYLINKNFQMDIYGGIGLSKISNDFILGSGLSYRF